MRRTRHLTEAALTALFVTAALTGCRGERVDTGRLAGNGTVEATEVEVSAKLAGRLASVAVREGMTVTAGQVVATLDSADAQAQVRQAEGTLASAEAAVRELRAGTRAEEIARLEALASAARQGELRAQARRDLVRAGPKRETIGALEAMARQASVALADAETELARARRLVGEGALPRRDLDQALARRDAAGAQADAAGQRLAEAAVGARPEEIADAEAAVAQAAAQAAAAEQALALAAAGPRRETIAAAEGRVASARGALEAAQSLLAQTTIVSPLAGTVTLRSAEPGEVVTPGMPILRLADLSSVWLRVYVGEPEIGKVRLGQDAFVTVDTFPGRSFGGKVVEIAEKPEFTPRNVQTKDERVKLVFAVKIEVPNPGGELKPGMPADAAIVVGAGG